MRGIVLLALAVLLFGCIGPQPTPTPTTTETPTPTPSPTPTITLSPAATPQASPSPSIDLSSDPDFQDEFGEIYSDLDAVNETG